MMTVTEKAAYLKGLAEMAHFEAETDEVKIIKAMIDVIDELALSVSDLEDEVAALTEQLDEVDEDLGDLEEYVYEDDCFCDDDCCCDDCGDDGCEGSENEYFEVECPACGETICLDESVLDEDSIQCPACGETLEFDFDDDSDEDDAE